MLSKAIVKYVTSLQVKKYRNQHQAFMVEGAKSLLELLNSDFEIQHLFITQDFLQEHGNRLSKGTRYELVTEQDLTRAGTFSSNNAGLAVAHMHQLPKLQFHPGDFTLALDDIRDPGNMGTIIRIADWYGIQTIVCSETCADFYNPKTISATMGSFTRVKAYYLNLGEWLHQLPENVPVYGASLDGENLHRMQLQPTGVVVMGNEANGIRPEVASEVNRLIKIPDFGEAESLNVATATAIIIDNFMRNARL
ncbi:RNA methyltransferase [Pontibacter sp. BAB1700]|uniref:TrmH family RNA methyltransferase n=1 Tax=Pontibacter sp. BAB1700 TaxID=1144253 RepID=UPI00026BCD1E|nr:RNA methyltransferase [Pontibacter sp. BAB1700]EJF11625.1 tRNA/rRNA methyltransferase SpoU [Pontibacter sp. BAB1700]